MTFTALVLTVASAFFFGILVGYLVISVLLKLIDRRPSAAPETVRVRVQATSSGD